MNLISFFLVAAVFVQIQPSVFEEELNIAYANAKKGIYYALSNIPDRKNSLANELIDNDKLVARVKLTKEVRGVKVESEGFNKTYEVKITLYRSYDNLLQEGFIKYIPPED